MTALSYDEIELESAVLLSGLDETSWKDSSSSLLGGVLDVCASSCSSTMAERSGDDRSGFGLWNMWGSMEKDSWTESFVGGSCEKCGLEPMSGSDGVEEVLLGGSVVCS